MSAVEWRLLSRRWWMTASMYLRPCRCLQTWRLKCVVGLGLRKHNEVLQWCYLLETQRVMRDVALEDRRLELFLEPGVKLEIRSF
jgi:hypothetical protein